MAVAGFRCSNSDFAYCITSGTKDAPTLTEKHRIQFPAGYSEPELFKWLYQETLTIFKRAKCQAVGIKKAEGTVRRSNALEARVQAEAIVTLAAADSGCHRVQRKVSATIAKDLGLKGKGKYLHSQLDTSPLAGFDALSSKLQESALVAWSCL
jgi:phosphohistidine swiveling domain-containing protein